MKKKLTAAQKVWLHHIKKQRNSNLSQSQYCDRYNLKKSSFSSMKCQLIQDGIILKREEIDSQEQGLFIPAKAKSQPFSVKIKLTNGLELSFDKVPDSEWMGKLLSSIGGNDVINQEL